MRSGRCRKEKMRPKRGSGGQTGMRKGKGEGRMEVADENMIGYIRRKGRGNR